MGYDRTEKLNSELRKNIYQILTTRVKNPNITEMFTITEVSCDRDLTFAKVFVSIFSTDEQAAKKTFAALQSTAPFCRRCLLKCMRIKSSPELLFVIDDRMVKQDNITKILSKLDTDEKDEENS